MENELILDNDGHPADPTVSQLVLEDAITVEDVEPVWASGGVIGTDGGFEGLADEIETKKNQLEAIIEDLRKD